MIDEHHLFTKGLVMNEIVNSQIEDYCRAHTTPMSDVFQALRQETYEKMTAPHMQVGALEGAFLKMLVALTKAHRVLELGTFTGFSALAMAEGLPNDGRVITCDIDPKATAIAKEHWKRSPHGHKIELRLGPGLESIAQIQEPLDLVFIDADKANYPNYWQACLPKLRTGGLIVVDNVLWSGKVLNPKEASDRHITAFNDMAKNDPRVEVVMLPVRDGMLLARKL
jgi:caffeoyl-CoA O-methyltransferase